MGPRIHETDCVISGGGPAGIMLGYLLARSGADVVVLEKWPDFFRDFRGDTIHPSTMEVLRELGLLEKFLALPHNETRQIGLHIGREETLIADFTHLKGVPPFLAFIPQWDFLNFLAGEGKQYPGFHLLMQTEATGLIEDDARIVGVHARDAAGAFEIRAKLVVGADGRHSTVRDAARLPLEDFGAPIDVLWFRIPRTDDGTQLSLGYADRGRVLILIDRDTYWQGAFIIKKGSFDAVRAMGLDAFRANILTLAPGLAEAVKEVKSWDDVKLLSVSVDHLKRWHRPGLVCIGDAAHAMSPVGGVGINLAVQDAVAAANILAPAFKHGGPHRSDLAALEARRARPALFIQRLQVGIHKGILARILASPRPLSLPWQVRLFRWFPYLRRLPAWLIGVGLRPEHVSRAILEA